MNASSAKILKNFNEDFKNQRNCEIALIDDSGNQVVKVHKIILFLCSKVFIKLVKKMAYREDDNELIKLQLEFSEQCLKNFAHYLYNFELNLKCSFDELIELLRFAFDFQIYNLLENCEDTIIASGLNVKKIETLLSFSPKTYLTKKLLSASVQYIKNHFKYCILASEMLRLFTQHDLYLKSLI